MLRLPLRLTRQAISVPLFATACGLLGLLSACGERAFTPAWGKAAPPPNVLLITIDTLRADRLGTYGYERPTSPRIDAFAETAVVFEQAVASASWTLPGLASVFTSLYTSTHGCWSFGSRLDDSFETFPELLTRAGYDTACVVSHLFCTSRHGLQQGFIYFDDTFAHPDIEPEDHVSSELISNRGIRFLEEHAASSGDTPFLLWLHYFDPHSNYLEHPGFTERFVEGGGEPDLDALYDGEIAFTDFHVGRVLDALEARGLAENTVVVLVSDHGEEFGEHGGYQHGHTLFAELVRVPLIIRAPGIAPRRVASVARTVDIHPTLLDVLGRAYFRPGRPVDGASLVDPMKGEPASDLPALAEIRLNARGTMDAVVRGRHKLVRHYDEEGSLFLYDLRQDPGETHDLSDAEPELTAELERILSRMVREAEEKANAYPLAGQAPLTPGVLENLRGLGYVGDE